MVNKKLALWEVETDSYPLAIDAVKDSVKEAKQLDIVALALVE